jgi:hypothetical protein
MRLIICCVNFFSYVGAVVRNIVYVEFLQISDNDVPFLFFLWIYLAAVLTNLKRLSLSCFQQLEVLIAHQINKQMLVFGF